MVTSDLVDYLIKAQGFTPGQARIAVGSMVSMMEGALMEGGVVKLFRFGTLCIRQMRTRRVRVPAGFSDTAPAVHWVTARPVRTVKFVTSPTFKKWLNRV